MTDYLRRDREATEAARDAAADTLRMARELRDMCATYADTLHSELADPRLPAMIRAAWDAALAESFKTEAPEPKPWVPPTSHTFTTARIGGAR